MFWLMSPWNCSYRFHKLIFFPFFSSDNQFLPLFSWRNNIPNSPFTWMRLVVSCIHISWKASTGCDSLTAIKSMWFSPMRWVSARPFRRSLSSIPSTSKATVEALFWSQRPCQRSSTGNENLNSGLPISTWWPMLETKIPVQLFGKRFLFDCYS